MQDFEPLLPNPFNHLTTRQIYLVIHRRGQIPGVRIVKAAPTLKCCLKKYLKCINQQQQVNESIRQVKRKSFANCFLITVIHLQVTAHMGIFDTIDLL